MQILKVFQWEKKMEVKSRRVLCEQIQKHITSIYSYKLVCVYDKFTKSFKTYLDGDAVYNFNNSMIEESKYCNEMIKNILTKNM